MKLDEFVKQFLLDITKAVADAQETSLLYVAPGYVNKICQDGAQNVKFEVAVTVNAEGGGGISVLSFGDLKGSIARETVSRGSFEVPVHFTAPTIHNKRHHKNEGPLDPLKE
ncbi:hypothetical protein [Rhizobium sp. 'Codium 1']|uniref:hypothetical protein n=1 Tax=Rhizobium sp. 'Codium 1' TaxID=2940484 RepID=UPI001E60E218|nr:hypothetical protein [Rhizobium sp. 'Codium 1']MCC8932295.1 hypothetical protein [Rhizobium sp. 'Codium 1']